MARGTESKNAVFEKLQEIYPSAFWEDAGKILRIPMSEDGVRVEIKVTLTAAKNNLSGDQVESAFTPVPKQETPPAKTEVTEEEKQNVQRLMQSLGL